MVLKKWFLPLAVLLALAACEKDEDDEVDSMEGGIVVDISQFLLAGDTLELYAGGIVVPQDVEYSWTGSLIGDHDDVSGYDTIPNTNHITLYVPDEIGIYELYVYAKASGYSQISIMQEVMVLSPDNSLTGVEYGPDTFKDTRDGSVYHITKAGSLDWFSENLNWNGRTDGGNGASPFDTVGITYSRAEVMGDILGRLYTWEDATGGISASGLGSGPQGACPDGWSVPTNEDWEDLAAAVSGTQEHAYYDLWEDLGGCLTVDARLNGEKVWPYSPDRTPENKFHWAALAGGYGMGNYTNFRMYGVRGFWWSSTEKDGQTASYRYIYYDDSAFPYGLINKDDFAASVRCVRLAQ